MSTALNFHRFNDCCDFENKNPMYTIDTINAIRNSLLNALAEAVSPSIGIHPFSDQMLTLRDEIRNAKHQARQRHPRLTYEDLQELTVEELLSVGFTPVWSGQPSDSSETHWRIPKYLTFYLNPDVPVMTPTGRNKTMYDVWTTPVADYWIKL